MGVRPEKKTAGKAPFGRPLFFPALRRFRFVHFFAQQGLGENHLVPCLTPRLAEPL